MQACPHYDWRVSRFCRPGSGLYVRMRWEVDSTPTNLLHASMTQGIRSVSKESRKHTPQSHTPRSHASNHSRNQISQQGKSNQISQPQSLKESDQSDTPQSRKESDQSDTPQITQGIRLVSKEKVIRLVSPNRARNQISQTRLGIRSVSKEKVRRAS